MFPVSSVQDLERIGSQSRWQHFERLVGFIFERNDFSVELGKVLVTERGKRQFDVIASNGKTTFAVDCKKWAGNRYKTASLKAAAEKHVERCSILEGNLGREVIPLIVTLLDEDIAVHQNVPVIPLVKLNSFIISFHEIKDYVSGI